MNIQTSQFEITPSRFSRRTTPTRSPDQQDNPAGPAALIPAGYTVPTPPPVPTEASGQEIADQEKRVHQMESITEETLRQYHLDFCQKQSTLEGSMFKIIISAGKTLWLLVSDRKEKISSLKKTISKRMRHGAQEIIVNVNGGLRDLRASIDHGIRAIRSLFSRRNDAYYEEQAIDYETKEALECESGPRRCHRKHRLKKFWFHRQNGRPRFIRNLAQPRFA